MPHGDALLIAALLAFSCTAQSSTPPFVDEVGSTSSLRFKSGARLESHFAQALALDPQDFCLELGQHRCAELHAVAIGGVDAYRRNIYQPATETGLSTTLIVERMALAACARRATLDFESPEQAEIFHGARAEIVERLYVRALQRRPAARELEILEAMHEEIAARDTADPARTWAVLACLAVTTTTEALFY